MGGQRGVLASHRLNMSHTCHFSLLMQHGWPRRLTRLDDSCSALADGRAFSITGGVLVAGGLAGGLEWHKGRPCESGACIEAAAVDDAVMIRSTANPGRTPLTMSRDEWREFLAGVKDGLFDGL